MKKTTTRRSVSSLNQYSINSYIFAILQIIYPKSDEQRQRLGEAIKNILLFRSLDPVSQHLRLFIHFCYQTMVSVVWDEIRCPESLYQDMRSNNEFYTTYPFFIYYWSWSFISYTAFDSMSLSPESQDIPNTSCDMQSLNESWSSLRYCCHQW